MQNTHPRIWLLASPYSGDNTQLSALAESLSWACETKILSYRKSHILSRFLPPSLRGLTAQSRAAVAPPYPDLIIGAGQPNEAVALWIAKNAPHKPKLVYLGTPWARLDVFDLVITTPQYALPERTNVLHLDLPLHKIDPEKLKAAAAIWAPKLKHLPRPWTAVLVGGASGPYTFDQKAGARLAAVAQKTGGSLLITTSARTPLTTAAALRAAVAVPQYFHQWSKNNSNNPFLGFLALADQFIVTADSISMLSEACATGKPVAMFDTELGRFAMRDNSEKISWLGRSFSATIFRIAMRIAPKRWSRDLRIVHRQLIKSGQAHWAGTPAAISPSKPTLSALELATARVKALFDL